MDTRDRVYLPILGLPASGLPEGAVDVESLFVHMLLFEHVVLQTHRLFEIRALVRVLGLSGATTLLESGRVTLQCEAGSFGSVNRSDAFVHLGYFSEFDRREYISDSLRELHALGLGKRPTQILKRLVASRLAKEDDVAGRGRAVIDQTFEDARGNRPMLAKALDLELARYGWSGRATEPSASIETVDNDRMVLVSFGRTSLGLDEHRKVSQGMVHAIANLNNAFSQMRRYEAITGLATDSEQLMDSKLSFLFEASSPTKQVDSLRRVVSVLGMPSLEVALAEGKLNVERFLEVCATAECREFRSFLRDAPQQTDQDLKLRAESLRARMGLAAQGIGGKALRLVATTGIGFLGPIAGVIAGGLDSFLVEKVLPTSGVVAFVGDLYPSCFSS